MNCCSKHEDHNPQQRKKRHLTHMLMMVLCCALPVTLILLIPFISSYIPGSAGLLTAIVPLLCPLMMIAMIPMMFKCMKGNNENRSQNSPQEIEARQSEWE